MKEIIYLFCCFLLVNSQRVAPGIPPQRYQHKQQYQQVPQYQQKGGHPQKQQVPQYEVPLQHQQVPVQRQVPAQQSHHHHEHEKVLDVANIAQEAQHIAEHMDVPINTSKMTEQEMQFHYFKMYDVDNNNKLDGCELVKSIIHWHEHEDKDTSGNDEHKVFKDEELVHLIDPILNTHDSNNDGYIDYPEFIRAQQRLDEQH